MHMRHVRRKKDKPANLDQLILAPVDGDDSRAFDEAHELVEIMQMRSRPRSRIEVNREEVKRLRASGVSGDVVMRDPTDEVLGHQPRSVRLIGVDHGARHERQNSNLCLR